MRSPAAGAARSRAFGFCTLTWPIPVWIVRPDHVRGELRAGGRPEGPIAVQGKKRIEFDLNRPCNQPTSAGSQNFGERIIDFVFLSERDDAILVHGVTLLLGDWGFGHQPRYAAFFTPSPNFQLSSGPISKDPHCS